MFRPAGLVGENNPAALDVGEVRLGEVGGPADEARDERGDLPIVAAESLRVASAPRRAVEDSLHDPLRHPALDVHVEERGLLAVGLPPRTLLRAPRLDLLRLLGLDLAPERADVVRHEEAGLLGPAQVPLRRLELVLAERRAVRGRLAGLAR